MNAYPMFRFREFDVFSDRYDSMASSTDDSVARLRKTVRGSEYSGRCNGNEEGPTSFDAPTKGREEEESRDDAEESRDDATWSGCKGFAGVWMRRRKLILHFDIRNTILVADSVTKVTMEQALNTFLTGVTWGRRDGDRWVWLSDVPSLGPPCPGAVTYYKHLEGQLARDSEDRARLRRATGDFTQTDLGKKFRSHFDKHLKLLEWHYEEAGGTAASDQRLTMVGPGNHRYHYLLPSFVRLISRLHADGREFAIVLRTYGMDASNVLRCIRHIVAGNHPLVPPGGLPISVDRTPGAIRRLVDGRILCERYGETEKTASTRKTIYKSEPEIYELLSGSSGILGFVDDFGHWQSNGYGHRAGKPLWVDPRDDRVQHIFFDDNIRVSADDSIVDVRLPTPDRRGGFESVVDAAEMASLENACLVQADLLQIITDLDYFVDKVKACEVNYDDLINRVSSERNNS